MMSFKYGKFTFPWLKSTGNFLIQLSIILLVLLLTVIANGKDINLQKEYISKIFLLTAIFYDLLLL